MLENQFIQITSTTLSSAKSRKPMPVCLDLYQDEIYKIFYDAGNDYTATKIAALDMDGNVILEENMSDYGHWLLLFVEQGGYLDDLHSRVNIGDTFLLRLTLLQNSTYYYKYSQPLVCVSGSGLVTLDYYCTEDAFGFPFRSVSDDWQQECHAGVMLPLHMHSPQNVQEDKTYVKANGEVVTLFAKYYKEWEVETEYLSEGMHDKIVAALSCDKVYIDGKRVTKSDNYQVDWENYDLDCDGVTKLAKATFKVREHVSQRNSNF